tara:strand:- start:172 stop:396 length:225 start_codon:yes stop_codon:yes gene_type:complete
MSKPISNARFAEFVKDMTVEKQQEVVSRQLRVLPQMIMDEVAGPNKPKVIKFLESRLRQVRLMQSSLYANGKVV